MIDDYAALQHEFVRKCMSYFIEDLDFDAREQLEEDLPEYAASIDHFGGYNLDIQLAALTAANQELAFAFNLARETCQKLEAERDGLRAALENMLYIFDRGLPADSIGRRFSDEARRALDSQT